MLVAGAMQEGHHALRYYTSTILSIIDLERGNGCSLRCIAWTGRWINEGGK